MKGSKWNILFRKRLPFTVIAESNWKWSHYEDGSGELKDSEGQRFLSYDLNTREYKLEGEGWIIFPSYPDHMSREDFVTYIEERYLSKKTPKTGGELKMIKQKYPNMENEILDMKKKMWKIENEIFEMKNEMFEMKSQLRDMESKMLDIESSITSVASDCKKEISDLKKWCEEQIYESLPIFASFVYEHNDGDQIWSDATTYYKKGDGTYIVKYKEGYYGKTSFSEISLEDIIKEMQHVRDEVERKKKSRIKGGYSIFKNFEQAN